MISVTKRFYQQLKIQWPGQVKKIRIPLWIIKTVNYEYWPFWIFLFPMAFYYLYLAAKARSLTYFTASNPGIEMGGVVGESKIRILHKINPAYLPKSLFLPAGHIRSEIADQLESAVIHFPLIVKPNIGERGKNVEKMENLMELHQYLQLHQESLIIQEFLQEELELGVLYYKYPDGSRSGISSVVKKEFLSVKGNGQSTIFELLQNSNRARFQINRLKNKLENHVFYIPEKEETILIEPIGNHCRGTKFLNANHLINDQLVKIFDQITAGIEGFYYGRFDLKVKDEQHLYAGQIKVMELNGVTSEAAHVYDPAYTIWNAYRDIACNLKIVYEISRQNHRKGFKYVSVKELAREFIYYLYYRN